MRWLLTALALALQSITCVAADHIIDFDHQVDFAAFRTFAVRGAAIRLDRPEVNSPLVRQGITNTIRAALTARGLKQAGADPDVIVDWWVGGQRFTINEWGNAIPLDEASDGMPVPRGNPWRNQPEAFVQGVLVVDLTDPASGLLIWRGVYRNRESGSGQLAHRLPDYARKLLSAYPPHRK
jgi:Domain of unknown function (DUF4136)